jgi:signal transduction histidine kinase
MARQPFSKRRLDFQPATQRLLLLVALSLFVGACVAVLALLTNTPVEIQRTTFAATALLFIMGLLLSWMAFHQMKAAEVDQRRARSELQEEARIAAGLARVGRALIAGLDTRAILERLCQLTSELLECDCSHTVLASPNEDVFVPVAGYGDSPEHWESMQLLKIPRLALANLLARLERDEVVEAVVSEGARGDLMTRLSKAYGMTATLSVGLRRGDAVIGYLDAGYRGRKQTFNRTQRRTARGIAALASLALANAQLLEKLERANRFRSEFVASMSHELRNPLNVIIGYSDLLSEGSYGPLSADQIDIVRRTSERARELLDLVTATLDLSRLEAQRAPLVTQDVRLNPFLEELAHDMRALPQKPGLELIFNVAADLPALRTDPMKLKMVLKNLVGNALKFTDRGTVTLAARVAKGSIDFSVADTGIGIARDALPVIFDAFRQGDNSSMQHRGGAGLGLYITRRLLDLLGGTIAVDSEVGRGSTFHVSLPLDQARGAAPAAARQ